MQVEQELRDRLVEEFSPEWLELENESHQHSVPANSETHFRVVMVSSRFVGKRAVARHQMVYAALADALKGPVHALAMHLFDAQEWAARESAPEESPACLGGSKVDAANAGRGN